MSPYSWFQELVGSGLLLAATIKNPEHEFGFNLVDNPIYSWVWFATRCFIFDSRSINLWRRLGVSITTRNREIPVGQKPSGITKKPSGMPFPTANRRESADRNSSSGKGTIPCRMADWKQSLSVIPVGWGLISQLLILPLKPSGIADRKNKPTGIASSPLPAKPSGKNAHTDRKNNITFVYKIHYQFNSDVHTPTFIQPTCHITYESHISRHISIGTSRSHLN